MDEVSESAIRFLMLSAIWSIVYCANSKVNVTELFSPTMIYGNECESADLDSIRVSNEMLLGYVGNDFSRYFLHIDSVIQINSKEYDIHAQTKHDNEICELDAVAKTTKVVSNNYSFKHNYGKNIETFFSLNGRETKCQKSYAIAGKLVLYLFEFSDGRIIFSSNNGLESCNDDYSNLQFKGTATLNSGETKKIRWGWARIPESDGLDCGAGEFFPCESIKDSNWIRYTDYYYACTGEKMNTDKCKSIMSTEKWWMLK